MKTIITFLFTACLFTGCSKDNTIVQPTPIDPSANCGNWESIDVLDSIKQSWPAPKYKITRLKISSYNGWWAGHHDEDKLSYTIFLYDPVADSVMKTFYGFSYFWSKDGKKFIFFDMYSNINIFDILNGNMKIIHAGNNIPTFACWSYDDSQIIVSNSFSGDPWSGIWKLDPDGSRVLLTPTRMVNARVLDENRILGFLQDTLCLFDIGNNSITKIFKSELTAFTDPEYFDVSPNGDFILLEPRGYHGYEDRMRPHNAVWLLDTHNWSVRKVLGTQAWNEAHDPSWASASTFFASVYCRKDSSSLIWEFDLNGNPIRQVSNKNMKMW